VVYSIFNIIFAKSMMKIVDLKCNNGFLVMNFNYENLLFWEELRFFSKHFLIIPEFNKFKNLRNKF